MKDPFDRTVVEVRFRLAGGEVVTRGWTMHEIEENGQPNMGVVPDFIDQPYRDWPHPQAPITFGGDVLPGREDEARAWVESR